MCNSCNGAGRLALTASLEGKISLYITEDSPNLGKHCGVFFIVALGLTSLPQDLNLGHN